MLPYTVLYDYAMKMVGLPYRWGGNDTIEGFDCSGLAIELLQAAGAFPRGQDTTAEGLRRNHVTELPDNALPRFGDLVFFGSGKATHVGFCLNNHQMIEAGGGGSTTQTEQDAADQNAYVRIRPIYTWRNDVLSVGRPNYPWNEIRNP